MGGKSQTLTQQIGSGVHTDVIVTLPKGDRKSTEAPLLRPFIFVDTFFLQLGYNQS